MKYELFELEQYLSQRLRPDTLPRNGALREQVAVHHHHLSLQIQRIRTIFKEDLTSMKDPDRARIYVPVHTLSILEMCQQLANWYQVAKDQKQEQLMDFYARMDRLLSDLVQILQKSVPAVFDYSQPLPFTTYIDQLPAVKQLIERLDSLKPLLDSHNQPVIDLIQAEVSEIWDYPRRVTFHLLEYTTRLLTALNQIKDSPAPDYNHYLHALLIRLNYNSPKYIEHCTFKLIEKTSGLSAQDKLDTIEFYVDELSKLVPLKTDCLMGDHPSALDQLKAWTFQEKKTLEKPTAPATGNVLEKIPVELSVDELAAFTYGALKAGVSKKDKSRLFRLIIAYFNTPGAENIAFDSFSNKSFKPKEAAKDRVRAMLRKIDDALR